MTTDYEQIKKDVETYLNDRNIKFNAQLIGETMRDEWQCDEWRVKLSRANVEITTAYYTGTGHRKPIKGAPADKGTKGTLYREDWEKRYLKPVIPHAADVLHSLLLDAPAIDESFEYWASNYGYDTDSRKALAIYEACCVIGKDMRKLFDHDEKSKLSEILQDF